MLPSSLLFASASWQDCSRPCVCCMAQLPICTALFFPRSLVQRNAATSILHPCDKLCSEENNHGAHRTGTVGIPCIRISDRNSAVRMELGSEGRVRPGRRARRARLAYLLFRGRRIQHLHRHLRRHQRRGAHHPRAPPAPPRLASPLPAPSLLPRCHDALVQLCCRLWLRAGAPSTPAEDLRIRTHAPAYHH